MLWGCGTARHEVRSGRDARAGLRRARARRRRDLGVLRGRGGGRPLQRARTSVRGAARAAARRRRAPGRADRRRDRGWLPGHDAAARRARVAHAPTPPGPGWAATPSTASGRCSTGSAATRVASRSSTAASTARRCRPSGSRAAWPATSCPTRRCSLVNHRFAPDRSPADAEAHLRELLLPAAGGRRRARGRRLRRRRAPGAGPPAAGGADRPQRPRPCGPSWAGPTWLASPPRHPGRQLRARRRHPGPHRGRACRPGADRADLLGVGRPAPRRRLTDQSRRSTVTTLP